MQYISIVLFVFTFTFLVNALADKIVVYIAKRKAKKLYKSFDCQANSFDIKNSMKGD